MFFWLKKILFFWKYPRKKLPYNTMVLLRLPIGSSLRSMESQFEKVVAGTSLRRNYKKVFRQGINHINTSDCCSRNTINILAYAEDARRIRANCIDIANRNKKGGWRNFMYYTHIGDLSMLQRYQQNGLTEKEARKELEKHMITMYFNNHST